jgi:fructose-bisphosphate aldolase class I
MTDNIQNIAKKLVIDGKGILAADESTATIKKRFDQIDTESNAETRRDYREMLFSTKEAMEKNISGVILYDETIKQKCRDGKKITDLLKETDTLIGIKVDTGVKKLVKFSNETITEGLDGLRERLDEYYNIGASFAKWRAVINITEDTPSDYAIRANSQALARYSALCQESGLVPIVEPEVLMDGENSRHNIDECKIVTSKTLQSVFEELSAAKVDLDGIILKPNMVIHGKNCDKKATPIEIAKHTLDCLEQNVPRSVAGICFLSGGQTDLQATEHLSIMNNIKETNHTLTFSYGRALQQSALIAWGGKDENIKDAQIAFMHRARMNGLASIGQWSIELDQ